MASRKAQEIAGEFYAHGADAIDAALSPLLDALEEAAGLLKAEGYTEQELGAEALLRAWGKK